MRGRPKLEPLIVKTIRRLQDVQGSTSKEIVNYISREYDISGPEFKRQIELALKRAVSYGILRRSERGQYTHNHDTIDNQPMDEENPMEPCKGRFRRGRRGRRKSVSRSSRRLEGKRRERRRRRSYGRRRSRRGKRSRRSRRSRRPRRSRGRGRRRSRRSRGSRGKKHELPEANLTLAKNPFCEEETDSKKNDLQESTFENYELRSRMDNDSERKR